MTRQPPRAPYCVVGEYVDRPSEGMQVVTRTVVEGLKGRGRSVEVVAPKDLPRRLPRLLLRQPAAFVFTHGPGAGAAAASRWLRRLTRSRIAWVMTRPDLPDGTAAARSAHVVIGNRLPAAVRAAAADAAFIHQYIGIDTARFAGRDPTSRPSWARSAPDGPPVALHVGHIRRNRGMDLLIQAKRRLGDRLEVILVGSPTFQPDPGLLYELEAAGVRVHREFVEDMATIYRGADLYLFCVSSEAGGAVDLPLSVLEALASGVPVLSTPFGSLPQALEGAPGVWMAPPEQFVAKLEDLVLSGAYTRSQPALPVDLHISKIVDAVIDGVEGP